MSFPTMNAGVVSQSLMDLSNAGGSGGIPFLATAAQYQVAPLPGVVDVSGMEFHLAFNADSATVNGQTTASAGSTLEIVFGDSGTTATGTASGNHLIDGDAFSNTVAGGYTTHLGRKYTGTSTTDIDADDWVAVHVVANATGLLGMAAIGFSFVYGKPGQIN